MQAEGSHLDGEHKQASSTYRGVYRRKHDVRWRAEITAGELLPDGTQWGTHCWPRCGASVCCHCMEPEEGLMVTDNSSAGACQCTVATHSVSSSRCTLGGTAGQATTAAVLPWATVLHARAWVLPQQLSFRRGQVLAAQVTSADSLGPLPRPLLLLQGARSAAWAATTLSRRQQKHMTRRR